MATPTQKPPSTEDKSARLPDGSGFGAYGSSAGAQPGIKLALSPPPASKVNGSLDFAESDKRWLKDLGLTTTNPLDFDKAWEPENVRNQPKRWAETYGGRLAIRSVSRGVVGAAFFAAAQIYAGRAMVGYTYTPGGKNPLPTEHWKKPLQFITKCIDKTVGQGIFHTVKLVKNEEWAKRAVTFRSTRDFHYGGKDKVVLGRSLGHEAVAITFDFAMMSFGDYMTRYVLGFFDPNAKIKWMKNGRVDMPAALKDVLKNVWTGVSYAAGEDMAVAIPYVYGMRLQRNIINKFSPGFKFDSDQALNGGGFKIDNNGKIIGDYQLEGMLDLSGRFSWYNVGTKMFRDTYIHTAGALKQWWSSDRRIGLPSIDPAAFTPKRLMNKAAEFVHYVTRTIIKVMMYMLPATFLFYITRSPQHKYLGMAIHPEKGPLGFYQKGEKEFNLVQADGSHRKVAGIRVPDDAHKKVQFKDDKKPTIANPFNAIKDGYEWRFEPWSETNYVEAPWYSKITNKIGKFCYSAGDVVNELVMPVGRAFGLKPNTVNDFSRRYANAAIAYTPYFMAKTDLGSVLWDTKRTDLGIDRMLDGVAHLKWGEFSGGFSEVYRSMLGQPFADPTREQLAKEAMKRDEEKSSNEGFQLLHGRGTANINDNSDEAGTGRGNGRKFATEDKKANRPTLTALRQSTAPKPREASWTEAMSKSEAESRNQTIH